MQNLLSYSGLASRMRIESLMLWKVEWYSIQNLSFAVDGSGLKFIFTVCMYFLYFSVAQLDLKLKSIDGS